MNILKIVTNYIKLIIKLWNKTILFKITGRNIDFNII